MNKKELIDKLSNEQDIPKAYAEKNLNAVLKCIIQSMKRNDTLKLVGFGTFKKRNIKASEITIPSGKLVKVPAHKRILFSVGKDFKDVVNNK